MLGFSLALAVSWRLAVVMMAMQPLIIASFYFKKVLMTAMSKKAKKAQVQGSQLASEAVVNHRTITAFSSQRRMLRLYEAAQEAPRKDNRVESWYSGFCLSLCQFSNTGSMALALWYGGRPRAGGFGQRALGAMHAPARRSLGARRRLEEGAGSHACTCMPVGRGFL